MAKAPSQREFVRLQSSSAMPIRVPSQALVMLHRGGAPSESRLGSGTAQCTLGWSYHSLRERFSVAGEPRPTDAGLL
jgi:hypothetical protein